MTASVPNHNLLGQVRELMSTQCNNPRTEATRVGMPKILLVEDNEMNRDMLSRRLIRRGYEVVLATNGQEGLALAESSCPDLILMDLSLPTLDGWEATRQIKSSVSTATIPIIALTAHAMSGDKEQALAVGCDDYDTKPIEFERLLEKIAVQLQHADKTSRPC